MNIREMLIAITGAAIFLGWGYYCVRWPTKAAESLSRSGKRPLSKRHIRFMGWLALAMGLGPLYALDYGGKLIRPVSGRASVFHVINKRLMSGQKEHRLVREIEEKYGNDLDRLRSGAQSRLRREK